MSRQVDTKHTKQVRIDAGWHKLLKMKAAEDGTTVKALVEAGLAEVLSDDLIDKKYKKHE